MIEYQKHDCYSAFIQKKKAVLQPCYNRATAGTFILNLLYNVLIIEKMLFFLNSISSRIFPSVFVKSLQFSYSAENIEFYCRNPRFKSLKFTR